MLTTEPSRRIDRESPNIRPTRSQSAIMAGLRIAQGKGWLAAETIEFVAATSAWRRSPPTRWTFYNMYDLKPVGKYKITVCTNLPCMLSGGVDAGEYLKKKLGIGSTKHAGRQVHAEEGRVHGAPAATRR